LNRRENTSDALPATPSACHTSTNRPSGAMATSGFTWSCWAPVVS
jgi:hypothetical protein